MGFEPTTSAVTGRRSNQLSHRAISGCTPENCTHCIRFLFSFQVFSLGFVFPDGHLAVSMVFAILTVISGTPFPRCGCSATPYASMSHAPYENLRLSPCACLLSAMTFLRLRSSFRPISSSQLHTSLYFHPCPIYLIVSKGSLTFLLGDLILRGASRLDAFSVYPGPSWLPSRAIGMTTGPPADGPSRSSRTKDSSSQISCARAG